jgi:meso-butanediol dehydrogenase/(S,S)-butanediol dehydrogenase/diacetyl reductase
MKLEARTRTSMEKHMSLLADKVVLVTGSAGGIGEAVVKHLLDEGANVTVTARTQESVDEVVASIGDRPNVLARVLDVADEDQFRGALQDTQSTFGRLDGIVNNAGVLIPNDTISADLADYDRTFDVNVKGMFIGCRLALPMLIAAGGGSIVNFGSINSLAAEKSLALYSASKGAVLMLTRAIAYDHAAQGVRANTVCPAFVDTPLNVPHYTMLGGRDSLEQGLADFQPIGRAIEPIEIAYAVSFLLSDRSKAITGSAFLVDGGVLAKA